MCGILLGICCIWDVREKKIPQNLTNTFFIISTGIFLMCYMQEWKTVFLGVLLGISIIGFSKISGGSIGLGDGKIICISGILLGFKQSLAMLLCALLLAAVWSAVLFAVKKGNRKSSLPFIPFLSAGYLITLWNEFGF